MSSRRLRIGISACFFHPDYDRDLFRGKRLVYMEESMSHWVLRAGAMPWLLPTSDAGSSIPPDEWMQNVDGLLLHGGSDVSPSSYGETPIRPEWSGDRFRDDYEIELLRAALRNRKPVLGVCRGAQVINVAFGGTLLQDIGTQAPNTIIHRDGAIYDKLRHRVTLADDSYLSQLYANYPGREIVSIHHQAVKDVGSGLTVEARAEEDGIIEALRLESLEAASDFAGERLENLPYVLAVQWHPEFHEPDAPELLDASLLVQDFLNHAAELRPGVVG